MAGLLSKIKNDVKKAGANKGKFIYFREGQKIRIRFLSDMDDGMEIKFHDSYEKGINVPCQELFGRSCKHCDNEELRTRSLYLWSVYNYEANEVQLFMFPVNNCSPVPALVAMYETYGTLTDRDYVISVSGKAQNKTFSVVPMDKVKFRNEKAKAYSEQSALKMLDKAFPCEDEENEEEIKPAKKKTKPAEDDEWSDGDNEGAENDYEEMTPKELYKLCKERKIEAKPKKNAKYYITLLKEYDEAHDDWDDEDAEDDWDDED